MTTHPLVIAAVLIAPLAGPAWAQDGEGFQRWPSPAPRDAPATSAPAGGGARERNAQPRSAPQDTLTQDRRDDSRGAPPARVRQRADERERSARVAVPRGPDARRPGRRDDRRQVNVYVTRRPLYRYTPRFFAVRPTNPFGPSYFYYGNLGWYPRATYLSDLGYYGRRSGNGIGEVRLRVSPRDAEVYVDGFFAGRVDDFDGIFQSLHLESGPYHLEVVAPGYEPLEVDVYVNAGQTLTYRGNLRPTY